MRIVNHPRLGRFSKSAAIAGCSRGLPEPSPTSAVRGMKGPVSKGFGVKVGTTFLRMKAGAANAPGA